MPRRCAGVPELLFRNLSPGTFCLLWLRCCAWFPHFSLATSFTEVRSRPVTAPCKSGRGARPTFLRCSFLQNTVCFPGRRCCCSPRGDWFYSSGASRVPLLRRLLRCVPFLSFLRAT